MSAPFLEPSSLAAKNSTSVSAPLLILFYLVIQVAYKFSGLTFFPPLQQMWFELPLTVVFEDPFRSAFYYHLSSPYFLLYAVGLAKLAPSDPAMAFYLFHFALGFMLYYCLVGLLLTLGVRQWVAILLGTAYVANPTFNMFMNVEFYDLPVSAFLVAAAYCLALYMRTRRSRYAVLLVACVTVVCAIRPFFHLALFFGPFVVAVLWLARSTRWPVAAASAVGLVIVAAPYVKNQYLFGFFGTSSFFGENLAYAAMQFTMPLEKRRELVEAGVLSPLGLCPATADYSDSATMQRCYLETAEPFRQAYLRGLPRDYSSVRVLQPYDDGRLHRNYLGNIGMSMQYQKDALSAIWHYPKGYLLTLAENWRLYFLSGNTYFYSVMGNKQKWPIALSYNEVAVVLPRISLATPEMTQTASPFLIVAFVALLAFAVLVLTAPHLIYVTFMFALLSPVVFYLRYSAAWSDWNVQRDFIAVQPAILAVLVSAAIAVRYWWPAVHRRASWPDAVTSTPPVTQAVVLFSLGCVFYEAAIANHLTGGETQRYRFYVDAFYLVFLGLWIEHLVLFLQSIRPSNPLSLMATNWLRGL